MLVISMTAAALRLLYLLRGVRYDEAATYLLFASRPLYVALSWYPAPNHPSIRYLFT